MKKTSNRIIACITAIVMVAACFCSFNTVAIYATEIDDTKASEPIALSVYNKETLVKEYTLEDLKELAALEGSKKYKYSGYNRNPSFYTYGDANAKADVRESWGPTVKGILDDAGVVAEGKQLIKFVAADTATESFTAEDLFAERYYFPNAKGLSDGSAAKKPHYANAEPVVPIIDLHRSESEMESVLRFGQKAPNDQNVALFVKYVADGGKIIVGDPVAESWPAVTQANYKSGQILPGTNIEFDVSAYKNKKVAVYYTIDGSDPTWGDAIYNYDKWGGINPPDISSEGTYVIKFKAIGSGKLDSEIATFTYTVKGEPSPAVPTGFTAKAVGYNKVSLKWNKVSDADGYEVLRYATGGSYRTIGTITNNTAVEYTDNSLATGTQFKYKVRAFKQLTGGQKVYSSATAVKSAVPKLATPVISKLTPSTKTINVSWKKVDGASGYEIYRAASKNSKYKCVKTITKGSTVTWKNSNLTKGRTYYYKIKAYRVVNGKKVYSSFSSIKYIKVK